MLSSAAEDIWDADAVLRLVLTEVLIEWTGPLLLDPPLRRSTGDSEPWRWVVSVSPGGRSPLAVRPMDFRQQTRVSRDAVATIEGMHEAFARRLGTAWGSSSFAALEVEHVATEHLTIDEFVRSLPVPTALATLRVDRIASPAFLEVNLPFALLSVERLLGGPGDAASAPVARRPTDLEAVLLAQELLGPAVRAVDEALRDVPGEPTAFVELETAPQPLQLGSPDDLLLLLVYRVESRGASRAQGLVTLAYPADPLLARLDDVLSGGEHADASMADVQGPLAETLADARVEVCVRLGGGAVPVGDVAELTVGDVLRFDHPVQRPADLVLDECPVGTAHLGRRRRHLAVQIGRPPGALGPDDAPALTPRRADDDATT